MENSRPRSLTIVAILLVVLAVLSTTSSLTARLGVGARRVGGAAFNGATANANPQGGNGGNFQGGNGGNFQGAGGNFQGRGGFNAFSLLRNTGINFQVIGYFTLGLTILGILLALLSAFGVWKHKRWGMNLGMLVAFLFLAGAVPGLFTLGGRNINWLRTSMTILTLVASVPILVYGVLPSVRDYLS